MKRIRTVGARSAAFFAVVALGLSACSTGTHSSDDHGSMMDDSIVDVAGDANSADVMFAQMMIPHHEQAVEMADLADSRASDPQLLALAGEIRGAQDPEIALMESWLEEWGVPVMPAGEAMDAHGSHGMEGMLTGEQLEQLAALSGPEFDTLFAQFMIEHHQGAVAMARDVLATGSDPRVAALAREIIVTQEKEILQLQSFLGGASSLPSVAITPSVSHVHGGFVSDMGLVVGTHDGVHTINPVNGSSTRVGSNRDDLMAFATNGEGLLVASGHPGLGSTAVNPLGLVTSSDGGVTWSTVSLAGEVDFHGLTIRGQEIVGWDTRGPLLWSRDGGQSWDPGPNITPTSLVWFNDQVWLAVPDRGVVTWIPGEAGVTNADVPGVLLAVSPDADALWRVDPDGAVYRTLDGEVWEERGSVTKIEALIADRDTAYAVTGTSLQVVGN